MTAAAQTQTWSVVGTGLLVGVLGHLDDAALDGPTTLPGWTRRHLLAHVACNAEALQRLVHWARTGEERAMYASTEQRDRDIETGAARPAGELRAWVRTSADALAADLEALDDAAWQARVRTAQGREVPATEIPWMRAREVFVHAVDLDGGVGFEQFPPEFTAALLDDVTTRRSTQGTGPALRIEASDAAHSWDVAGEGDPVPVNAPLAVLAAWLTGRPVAPLPGPELPRWL